MPSSSESDSSPATNPSADLDYRDLVGKLVRALDAKKEEELRVLHVSAQSSITDYLILASGMANPHLRALRIEIERVLDEAGAPIAGVESSEDSGWLVFDAFQIMVHLFMPEQRDTYQLEQLWRDAEEIDVAPMLTDGASDSSNQGRPVN